MEVNKAFFRHDIQVYNTETLETHATFSDNHTNVGFIHY